MMGGIPSDSSQNLMLPLQKKKKEYRSCNFYVLCLAPAACKAVLSNPPADFLYIEKENRTIMNTRLLDNIEKICYCSQSATWVQHLLDIRKCSCCLNIVWQSLRRPRFSSSISPGTCYQWGRCVCHGNKILRSEYSCQSERADSQSEVGLFVIEPVKRLLSLRINICLSMSSLKNSECNPYIYTEHFVWLQGRKNQRHGGKWKAKRFAKDKFGQTSLLEQIFRWKRYNSSNHTSLEGLLGTGGHWCLKFVYVCNQSGKSRGRQISLRIN